MALDQSLARDIPLNLVDPARIQLRSVRRDNPDYLQILDSMESFGHLLNSILVRPHPEEAGRYEVADGMHRWTAANELRWDTIQAIVCEMDDHKYRRAQLEANAQHIGTDPVDYAARLEELRKFIEADQGKPITLIGLADYCNRSSEWVREMLGLNKLAPSIKPLVARGVIPLMNARIMARLPWHIQVQFTEMAQVSKKKEFRLACSSALNDYRQGIKNGFIDLRCTQEIVPYFDYSECIDEMKTSAMGAKYILRDEITDPLVAWQTAIKWALHMDPDTVTAREEEFRKRELKRFDEAALRKEARQRVIKLRREHDNESST